MPATISAPAPRKPRKPRPAPKKADVTLTLRVNHDKPPEAPPATEGQVALWRAWTAAIRSARRAVADLEALAWLSDEPASNGALGELERDDDYLTEARFRESCHAIAHCLTLGVDAVVDAEIPEEVAFLLGRYDRKAEPRPIHGSVTEGIRLMVRDRIVKRLGKYARPTAPARRRPALRDEAHDRPGLFRLDSPERAAIVPATDPTQ